MTVVTSVEMLLGPEENELKESCGEKLAKTYPEQHKGQKSIKMFIVMF